MSDLLIYGSYGYVGDWSPARPSHGGAEPVLAGRDREALADLAEALDRPARQFDLGDPSTIPGDLAGIDCVLNCAGPFSNTAGPWSRPA